MADMLVKLYALPDSRPAFEKAASAGAEIRRALAPEKALVSAWVRERFGEGWANEAEVCFAREPISCFLAIAHDQIVGFSCHDAVCRNFFGPTGVDPKQRKAGIGKALLFACLEAMKAQGYGYAIIGGVGPADYYSKAVGARVIDGSEPGIYRGLLRSPRRRGR